MTSAARPGLPPARCTRSWPAPGSPRRPARAGRPAPAPPGGARRDRPAQAPGPRGAGGDRVVIDGWTPANRGHRFTLRVIGLPGDEISCAGGAVHRDGVRLDEPYAAGLTDCTPVTVPTGTLYLLGDNREVANDSRFQGPADASGVRGRVL